MVHENKSIRNRILVEDVPSALQHLTDILEAMRENRVLEIEYHPFYLEESQHPVLAHGLENISCSPIL